VKTRIWFALITVYIVWGSTYLAIRFAVESMPPFLMAAIRFLIAGGILFIWRKLAGDKMPTKIEWRSAAIVGLLLLTGGNGNVVWAEQRVASGVAALIVGSAPLWMVTIDAIRPGGKKANLQTWTGVIIGFIGIMILISPWNMAQNSQQLDKLGVLSLLLGGFLWAIGSLYSRNARLPGSPLLGTGMEMLAGGAGLLILGTLTGEWGRLDLSTITARSIWGLVYLIVFGALVGYSAYTWLLRNAPTPLVSTYAYVNPLVAIFLGSMLAAEPLTPRILIAALIVVSSVALINTARADRASSGTKAVEAPVTGND
jgi:drug/metabolite transporter (DMT)-like permease